MRRPAGASRWRHRLAVVALALLGATAGLLAAGRTQAAVGPFDATLSVRYDLYGDTVVRLAPLGSLRLDTHDGPIGLEVRADQLRPDAARGLLSDPEALEALDDTAGDDLREAVRNLMVKGALGALLGALVLALARQGSWRAAALGTATAALFLAGIGLSARATWDARAIQEPRYTGLLTAAPRAVGSVRDIRARYDAYRGQLSRLIGNVAGLYQAASTLEALDASAETVRVLHVSDLHLNPQGFDLIAQLKRQFNVDAVVDSGDIVDWGTEMEARYTEAIGGLGVPYVYVRGNHDSPNTAAAVASQANAVVLDDAVTEVKGIRIWGIGDPRFTPDKSTSGDRDEERRRGREFADEVAERLPPDIDVVLVHDPAIAGGIGGRTPLVLAGHMHQTRARKLAGDGDTPTLLLVEGSTGGAGLRALEGDKPEPLTASVLHFDAATRRLVAYDRVTVSGLGSTEVRIERHLVAADEPTTTTTTTTTSPSTAPPTTSLP